MKLLLASGTLILALAVSQAAYAATSPYFDFDVISVVPRSPSVKPLVMAVPAKGPNRQLASKGVRTSETGR